MTDSLTISIAVETIAVDFDGTCVNHVFPLVGAEAPHAVRTLRDLVQKGHKLILWTMRSGDALRDAVQWFEERQIPLFGINSNPSQRSWTSSPKAYAQLYIDDAAFGAPLTHPSTDGVNWTRPCIDWLAVRRAFQLGD